MNDLLHRLAAALACLAVVTGFVAAGESGTEASGLGGVRAIHVASLGPEEAASAYRGLLCELLEKSGFQIADSAKDADAVLSGVVYSRSSRKGVEVVFQTAVLRSRDGSVLWYREVPSSGSMNRQAKRIVKSLTARWKRAVWEGERAGKAD